MSHLKSTTAVICLVLMIGLVPLNTASASPSNESGLSMFFAAPLPPTYYSPANGSTGLPQSVQLKFNKAVGATRYNVQVATDAAFKKIVFHTNIPGSPAYFTAPVPGGTYYWRVNSYNPDGTSKWGATWSFTTLAPVLTVPYLYSPANGAVGVPLSTDLTFSSVVGATRYNVQVSTNSSFTAIVFHENIAHSPAHFNAPYAGTFYWRIQAAAQFATSKWSAPRSFTTVCIACRRPELA